MLLLFEATAKQKVELELELNRLKLVVNAILDSQLMNP
jgi:hypothetical protein